MTILITNNFDDTTKRVIGGDPGVIDGPWTDSDL